jgi:hypothetical protein
MSSIQKSLALLWLNHTQILLYTTGLSLWSAPISRIAQKANIHRVTAYDSIKWMVFQWYFLEQKKWSTSFYQPIHPDILYQKQVDTINTLESILPNLRDLMSSNPIRPRVQFVEWLESCKQVCRHLLEDTKVLDSFLGSPIKNQEMLDFIDGEFETKRIKKKIKQRIVASTAKDWSIHRVVQKKRMREKVCLPKELLNIQCGVYLYGKNTIMYNFFSNEEMSAVIIESKQLYNTWRSLFDCFWAIK